MSCMQTSIIPWTGRLCPHPKHTILSSASVSVGAAPTRPPHTPVLSPRQHLVTFHLRLKHEASLWSPSLSTGMKSGTVPLVISMIHISFMTLLTLVFADSLLSYKTIISWEQGIVPDIYSLTDWIFIEHLLWWSHVLDVNDKVICFNGMVLYFSLTFPLRQMWTESYLDNYLIRMVVTSMKGKCMVSMWVYGAS